MSSYHEKVNVSASYSHSSFRLKYQKCFITVELFAKAFIAHKCFGNILSDCWDFKHKFVFLLEVNR